MFEKYLTHNFLKREYEESKRSCLDIGREIGCSSVTVHNYLKKFSIPRRSKFEMLTKKRAALTKEQKMKRREKLLAKANKLIAEVRHLQDRMKYPLSPTEKEANRLKGHAKQKRLALEKLKRELEFDNQRDGGAWHTGDWRDQLYEIMEHTRDKS